ncbi:MAG: BrnT family toxin [Oleibacter sp.]|nr:BrnT family toxin [Thalassolituus sp.]
MKIEFDPEKNRANITKHGVSFAEAKIFDFDNSLIAEDGRQEYGETRYIALGILRHRLHVLVFTLIKDGIRVISLRKANSREVKLYEQASDR